MFIYRLNLISLFLTEKGEIVNVVVVIFLSFIVTRKTMTNLIVVIKFHKRQHRSDCSCVMYDLITFHL